MQTQEKRELPPPPPGWTGPPINEVDTTEGNDELANMIEATVKRIVKSTLDPKQQVLETLEANYNENIEAGDALASKSRIFSGNTNRVANLIDYLKGIGCNTARLDKIRVMIFGTALGYCTEVPAGGLRSELIDALNNNKPKALQPPELPTNGQQQIQQHQEQPEQ
jgi:hypothetical protein